MSDQNTVQTGKALARAALLKQIASMPPGTDRAALEEYFATQFNS